MYEKLVPNAAIPRSLKSIDSLEDKEGNMLCRVVVMSK
jgi:hypothetical protein